MRDHLTVGLLCAALALACPTQPPSTDVPPAPGANGSRKGTALTEMSTKYRVGQIWKFRPRPGEEGATLTVVRVESSPDAGVIVHVSVNGVHIRSPRAPGGFIDKLQHAPFSEAAIAKSVTELMGETKTLPAFEEGYREWRRAFDAGKGGVFAITVAEAVAVLDEAINK